MRLTKRIRTVLYGDQRISACELELLHTPALQRLYGLRQLGFADRVFIDASHSRLHHIIGVLQQVDKLVSAIVSNLKRGQRTFQVGNSAGEQLRLTAHQMADIVQKKKPVIRLIGLLHDLTHAPFGHTVEDEIQLVESKHDEPSRQADAFYRLLCQLVAWLTVEAGAFRRDASLELPLSLRPFLSQGAESEPPEPSVTGSLAGGLLKIPDEVARSCWRIRTIDLAQLLAQLNCAMTALLHLEALHDQNPSAKQIPTGEYQFQLALRTALAEPEFSRLTDEFTFEPHRDAYMLDIVGNTVCADLLDYAHRDSHFAGLRLDYDPDRIAENFTLVSWDSSAYELERTGSRRQVPDGCSDPFAGWCIRTAISLFSHKFRTDVPGELMNLLNVRFYLYERVVYHPTKCASGAMLGTALQMLGWHSRIGRDRPELPYQLRFVGDDVFLNDLRAAAQILVDWCNGRDPGEVIGAVHLEALAPLSRTHNGLVSELLKLRVGQSVSEAKQDFSSALLLLDRLGSRRYYRPVFRALPSSKDLRLQVGAAGLASIFRQPDVRYATERRIEIEAGLPIGSVVIHCPLRKTAEKIANVLLVNPGPDAVDEVCKLRDIKLLDEKIFGEHQHAIQAVESMYSSMWRLVVYVAPEHLVMHKKIAESAGRVVFETIDHYGHFSDSPNVVWQNDPHLETELEEKSSDIRGVPTEGDESELSGFGALIGRLTDDLLDSGQLGPIAPEFVENADNLSLDLKEKLGNALRMAFAATEAANANAGLPAQTNVADRAGTVISITTGYLRYKKKDLETFRKHYNPLLCGLEEDKFSGVLDELQTAIGNTPANLRERQGWKLKELTEVLDEILRKHGVDVKTGEDRDLFN